MLSWFDKIKRFVYRTIHSSPEVQPTVLTMPFDAVVMVLIFASVVIVFAVTFNLPPDVMDILKKAENAIVAIFTVEYVLRLWTANLRFPRKGWFTSRVRYVFSVSAIVDLLAILPSLTPLSSGFRLLKLLRAFRAFRVVKFLRYSKSVRIITAVLREQRRPLLTVLGLAIGYTLVSALFMFNAEPDSFDTFFDAAYWATTALTTVGYGDIYPVTHTGKIISMLSSFVGIAIVALPSGIITAGYMDAVRRDAEAEKEEEYHGNQI